MAAGGEEGRAAEPEPAAEPEVAAEEPRSFKDLVSPGWSRFCPCCSLRRPAYPAGGSSSHSPVWQAVQAAGGPRPGGAAGARRRGGADAWAAVAASIRGRRAVLGQEVWGVQASAPVRLALPLCSVLLSRLPVSSVALTCPRVFLFPCSWDIPRGEERRLGVRGKILL